MPPGLTAAPCSTLMDTNDLPPGSVQYLSRSTAAPVSATLPSCTVAHRNLLPLGIPQATATLIIAQTAQRLVRNFTSRIDKAFARTHAPLTVCQDVPHVLP